MALSTELKRIREASKEVKTESDVRISLVDPILLELGWDIKDTTQVKTEHNVGKNTGRVDYSLSHPKSGKCVFIEVKSLSKKLDDYQEQIFHYGMKEGVRLCILTNGIKWWFYLPFYSKRGKRITLGEKKFLELNINEARNDKILINEFKTYLSFENLAESYKVEKNASKVLEARIITNKLTKKFPEIWQKMLKNPPPELIELIQKRVKSNTRIPTTKEQVKHLLSMQASTGTDSSPIPTGKYSVPIENKNKPVAFTLFGEKHPVKYMKDVWEGVASELYKKHTDTFAEVVGKPDGKRSYVELSESPKFKSRRIMNSQYWIDTHAGTSGLQSRCYYLLKLFGYSETELKIHF